MGSRPQTVPIRLPWAQSERQERSVWKLPSIVLAKAASETNHERLDEGSLPSE